MKNWGKTIDKYIAEGRTVSGGDFNPPGKPGYKVITLSANDEEASQQLTAEHDNGFEVVCMFVSTNGIARVILENYKGK